MVGLPGADLFIFCDTHAEFGRQSHEIRVAGASVAVADVDQAQPQGPADSRVGAVDDAGAHGGGAEVYTGLLGDWAVNQDYGLSLIHI